MKKIQIQHVDAHTNNKNNKPHDHANALCRQQKKRPNTMKGPPEQTMIQFLLTAAFFAFPELCNRTFLAIQR